MILDYELVVLYINQLVELYAVCEMGRTLADQVNWCQCAVSSLMTLDQTTSEHLSFYLFEPQKYVKSVHPVGVHFPPYILRNAKNLHLVDKARV